MRKLLINSTALATVAALTASVTALTASVAVADVSISASTEFKYISRSSQVTATDGTETKSDSEVVFKFSNKTDNGLTIGYVVELQSDGGDSAIDESSFSIEGGFGKVVLGENDGVGENFGIAAVDLIAEENLDSVVSARVSTSSDIIQGNSDTIKIAYFLPPMGGLTVGVSQADAGATSGTDTTSIGLAYAMEAAGASFTLGGASTTTPSATAKDVTSNNYGVKYANGPLKVTFSQGSYAAVDEDRMATGVAASYVLANGITLGAYMVSSDDDMDLGESYDSSGVEAQYTIAAGLTAVVNVGSYDYKVGSARDTDMSTVSDNGSSTSLTIKAAF
jgi:hypothetical protein